MKIKIKYALDFCSALLENLYLEITIASRQGHKDFIKSTYSTIILTQHVLKFRDLNFLCFSKVFAFLDNISSLT